ncbi:BQ2448_7801 [Microbotryum intermedium]|uniref:BQ2448_7801 protein n=1 Tax=Microbotryum intermedium TaxID=269621 RepID=A0A238FLY3_9BASI|nr:BQ2448_7801 [Microbotryum intermedium]
MGPRNIHGLFVVETTPRGLSPDSQSTWTRPGDFDNAGHLDDHDPTVCDFAPPIHDHVAPPQSSSPSIARSSYRLSSHYPLESSNPRPASRSGDRGDPHQPQSESIETTSSSHPFDGKHDTGRSSTFDRSHPWASLSNKSLSSEAFRDGSHSTHGQDETTSGQTSAAASSPSAPADANVEPTEDQVKSQASQSVDLLTKSLDLLSFLKEQRAATPVIKLPIPIASSAEAQGVVGESSSGPLPRSSHAATRGSGPITIDGRQMSRSQRVREDPWVCSGCQTDLGWLLLRDPASAEATSYRALFLCNECNLIADEQESSNPDDVKSKSEANYYNSFTMKLEEEAGHSLPAPRRHGGLDRIRLRKKRKEMDDWSASCDVCARIMAWGNVSSIDRDEAPPDLLVEFVCASCYDRYRRCTDCGSRFTPRVGSGKWRLKELFADGKRSCSLPHRPLVLEDTTCDTWRVSHLPHGSEEFEALLHETHKALVATTMSVAAIPDTMESDSPLCVDFRSAAMVCNDVNSILTSLMTQDIEEELGIRRYLAIRWHNPSKQERGDSFVLQSQDPDVIARERPERLMREGFALHSYVCAELDLKYGTVGIHAMVPRGIGHSYFAQTLLAQALLVRIRADLLATNTSRLAQGLDPFPKVHEIWNFMSMNKGSRVLQRNESQRGMIPLEDYLKRYKNVTDASHFPPIRPFFLPDSYLPRYRFYARRFGDDDALTANQESRNTLAATKRKKQQSVPTE